MKMVRSVLIQSRDDRKNNYIRRKVSSILGNTTNGVFGWTINIPVNYRVKVAISGGKRTRIKWCQLTQSQQINYFRDVYFPEVVKYHVDKCVAVPEFTQKGNVHFHCICQDASMVNDYDMKSTQRTLLQNKRCIDIIGVNTRKAPTLNYLHYLQSVSDWIDYLEKDIAKHEYPIIIISDYNIEDDAD